MSAAYSKIEQMERNRVSRAVPDLLSAFDEKKQINSRGTMKQGLKKKPNLMLQIDEEDEDGEDKIKPAPLTVK